MCLTCNSCCGRNDAVIPNIYQHPIWYVIMKVGWISIICTQKKNKKNTPYRLSFHKVVDCCSYEPHTPFHVLGVTLSTSLFMFHLISFSPYFIVHVSSYFLQSTLHWSCLIFISFSPQSISYISPTTVHLVHVYLIWLYLYYMVIQPHCQFHFSANPVSGN